MLGLDLSNYTTNRPVPGSGTSGGFITDEDVQCWRLAGYHHAIIGTQWPAVFEHQAQVCLDGGMTIDAYSWLGWERDLQRYILDRNALIRDLPVKTHWLDAEQERGGFTQDQIVDKIALAVEVAQQERSPGIYTAAWWWPANTRNSTRFSHLPLWHAGYPFREGVRPSDEQIASLSLDEVAGGMYGGWKRPTVWQFAGSVQLCSTNQDLNLIDDSYLAGGDPMPITRFVRHNVDANPGYWTGFRLGAGEETGQDVRGDFGLPPHVTQLQVQFYLESGSMLVMDGATENGVAGEVTAAAPFIVPRWFIDENGAAWFKGGPEGAVISAIRCLGYYE